MLSDQNPQQVAENDIKLPKLSLWIMMLWLTLSGVGLAVFSGISADFYRELRQEEGMQFMATASQVLSGLLASATAAQIIGLGVLVIAWRKCGSFLRHPGHWFIVIACTMLVVSLGTAIASRIDQYLVSNYDWTLNSWRVRLHFNAAQRIAAVLVVPISLNLVAAYFHRRIWRWTFLATAAQVLAGSIVSLLIPQMPLGFSVTSAIWITNVSSLSIASVTVLLVAYVVARERSKQVSRDWVHWVGVLTMLAGQLLPQAGNVFSVM